MSRRSARLTTLNPDRYAGDQKYVERRDYNDAMDDMDELYPSYNVEFTGEISFSKMYTNYSTTVIDDDLELTIGSSAIVCGGAEVRLIADGSHSITFASGFTEAPGSDIWDTTDDAEHKLLFYYDGTDYFYKIILL